MEALCISKIPYMLVQKFLCAESVYVKHCILVYLLISRRLFDDSASLWILVQFCWAALGTQR